MTFKKCTLNRTKQLYIVFHAKSSSTDEYNIQSSQFILKEKDGIKEFDLSLVLITVQQC